MMALLHFSPIFPSRPTNLSIGQFGVIRQVTGSKKFVSLN
jgi:hypothetical protein